MIKFSRKKMNILLCVICSVVAIAEVLAVQLVYYHSFISSDLAGNFLAAYVGMREHSVIPSAYNHTSTLGFESHMWLMPFLLFVFQNIKIAAIISNLLMLFLFYLCSYMLFRSFEIDKTKAYLCALLFILPFNYFLLDMHVMSQFYLIQLIGACFTVALLNYAGNVSQKRFIVYCFLGALISFLEGLNGSRYIVYVTFPLAFVGFIFLFTLIRRKRIDNFWDMQIIHKGAFLMSAGLGAGGGYLAYLQLVKYYSTYYRILDSTFIPVAGNIDFLCRRLRDSVYQWFVAVGVISDIGNMLSAKDIQSTVCIVFAVCLLVIPLKLCFSTQRDNLKAFAYFSVVSFASSLLFMTFVESIIITQRYWYFTEYYLFFLFTAYYLKRKKNLKEVLKNFGDTVLLVAGIMFILVSQTSELRRMWYTYQLDNSDIMTFADYEDDINEWLINNGYQYGYATYWHANSGTALAECQVVYAAISIGGDMNLYPWFGGMVRDYYQSANYTGKTFIMLTYDEEEQVKEILPAGYSEVYRNDLFILYGCDSNPFDFSVDLLQYFPVKGETIELGTVNFYTEGQIHDDAIALAADSIGGFLIYGPYVQFPIDGSYNVEYNFSVNNTGDGGSVGYVAVIAEGGGTILAKKDIQEDGELSIVLDNVFIHTDDSAVEFVIYINPGCDAVFKDVKITRIR